MKLVRPYPAEDGRGADDLAGGVRRGDGGGPESRGARAEGGEDAGDPAARGETARGGSRRRPGGDRVFPAARRRNPVPKKRSDEIHHVAASPCVASSSSRTRVGEVDREDRRRRRGRLLHQPGNGGEEPSFSVVPEPFCRSRRHRSSNTSTISEDRIGIGAPREEVPPPTRAGWTASRRSSLRAG